jgi:hypothetical protein
MSKEQQELLDEAYENYLNNFIKPICPPNLDVQPDYYKPMTKEWFIKSTKENNSRGQEFSEKWGLKIEERELSAKERWDWYRKNGGPSGEQKLVALMVYEDEEDNSHIHSWLKTWAPNVPTKLITITYNDKTIESYE